MPEMKTLTCPGPPEHEFQVPKGRGRPPKYCKEHRPTGKEGEQQVSEETKTRPRPGNKSNSEEKPSRPRPRAPRVNAEEKHPLDTPTEAQGDDPKPDETRKRMPPPRGDTGSRGKAESAHNRAVDQQPEAAHPRGIRGNPMAKIEMACSELIPTGQYANVTVGPVRITAYVDLDRDSNGSYFTDSEKETIVKAANELAEMSTVDIIGVQRNLVLESLQRDE